VVAIAQEGDRLTAVRLVKAGTGVELDWTRSVESGAAGLSSFAAECGLCVPGTGKGKPVNERSAVVGFDSAMVVFYRIDVPSVNEEELEVIVRLQAEARLPLPAEQMELAWRKGTVQDGQTSVTVAGARKAQLQGFVEQVRGFEPGRVMLNYEGLVKAWRTFFGGTDEKAVVVSICSRSTQICLAENGRLTNAASLDVGLDDLASAAGGAEHDETAERFCRDLRSILELFGCTEPGMTAVHVLSSGGGPIETVVSYLRSRGLSVQAALPDINKLGGGGKFNRGDVYEYRVPIGLAAMALEGDVGELNLFGNLYQPEAARAKKRWYHSVKVTGAIAAAMLILAVVTSYIVVISGAAKIDKLLAEQMNIAEVRQRQELVKAAARRRIDLLELINEINAANTEGLLLDSLSFKQGQPVTIGGRADNAEKAFKLQKNLQERKGISHADINAAGERKGDKVQFTITFHYKSYTRKMPGV